MSSVRLRRLQADFEKLKHYISRHPRLMLVQAQGQPPEKYQIEYRVRSLRQKSDQLEEVSSHLVEVTLPLSYPRLPPQCRMLTPVFHPNIAPHAICIGDHWSPGETLESIVRRIGEMLAYQSYNTKSPLNGEAARWVDQNLERLPLDRVSMDVEEKPGTGGHGATATTAHAAPATAAPRAGAAAHGHTPPGAAHSSHSHAAPHAHAPTRPPPHAEGHSPAQSHAAHGGHAAHATPPPAAAGALVIACPACAARLRVTSAMAGKRVRCPKCQAAIPVPAA